MADREGLRDRRLHDAHFAAGTDGELEHNLPASQALRVQLVGAELLERDDLQLGRVRADARNLQRVQNHDPAIALLRVEKGVRDRHRHFVPELGRTNGVAVDQDVGHGPDPNYTGASDRSGARHGTCPQRQQDRT